MKHTGVLKIFGVLVAVLSVTACREEPQVVEQIRALKTVTVTEPASGHERQFSGIVQATHTSSLSFHTGCSVSEAESAAGAV